MVSNPDELVLSSARAHLTKNISDLHLQMLLQEVIRKLSGKYGSTQVIIGINRTAVCVLTLHSSEHIATINSSKHIIKLRDMLGS